MSTHNRSEASCNARCLWWFFRPILKTCRPASIRTDEDAFERRCTQQHIEKAYHSPTISARTSATELHNGAPDPLKLRYSNCTLVEGEKKEHCEVDTRGKAFPFLLPYSYTKTSHSILIYHSIGFLFILKLFCRENNVCWVLPESLNTVH